MTTGKTTTWSDRCAPDYVEMIRDSVREALESSEAAPPHRSLAVEPTFLACMLALEGPAACKPSLERGQAHYEYLLNLMGPKPGGVNSVIAASVLQWEMLCMACGVEVPRITERKAFFDMLRKERAFVASGSPTLAFLAIAEGRPSDVSVWLDGKPVKRFTARETFGFDAPGFAQYLVKAVKVGAPLEDVMPAWDDFVVCFPRKLSAGTLDDPDLVAAARVVYETIGKMPTREVARLLHEKIMSLVQAGS
jgi:hypothetical protein